MGSNPTPSASVRQKRSQVQAAVRGAVGFHQWSGHPPTIERIIERRSHQGVPGRPAPPSMTRIVTVVAGMAIAFIVVMDRS